MDDAGEWERIDVLMNNGCAHLITKSPPSLPLALAMPVRTYYGVLDAVAEGCVDTFRQCVDTHPPQTSRDIENQNGFRSCAKENKENNRTKKAVGDKRKLMHISTRAANFLSCPTQHIYISHNSFKNYLALDICALLTHVCIIYM